MLRVAIIGCGKIADAHAAQIRRIGGCQLVGVCDKEELMAEQLAERFSVERSFSEVDALIKETRPQVVHICTPPQFHVPVARQCFQMGCHAYVEKPVALSTLETEEMIDMAESLGLKLTAGHDAQFSHVARRMRQLVQRGYLGDGPVHMESYYCYQFGDGYAKAVLADKRHWVRRLPGGLLHNIISHGVARIAEFLRTDDPEVIALGRVSPSLSRMGETELVDELRVIISDRKAVTAYFTFSSQMRPTLHEFRIYGQKNGLVTDEDHQTLIKLDGQRYKSFAEKFVPPVDLAWQFLGNAAGNVRAFLASDFHMKSGLKCLIESFYRAVAGNEPVPIPYREIVLTSRIMDRIFDQIREQRDCRNPNRIGIERVLPDPRASRPAAEQRS